MEFDMKNKELVAGLHIKLAHALFMSKKIIMDYGKVALTEEAEDGILGISLKVGMEMVTALTVLAGMCLQRDLIDRGALDVIFSERLDEDDAKKMAHFIDLITKDSNLFSIGENNDATSH